MLMKVRTPEVYSLFLAEPVWVCGCLGVWVCAREEGVSQMTSKVCSSLGDLWYGLSASLILEDFFTESLSICEYKPGRRCLSFHRVEHYTTIELMCGPDTSLSPLLADSAALRSSSPFHRQTQIRRSKQWRPLCLSSTALSMVQPCMFS